MKIRPFLSNAAIVLLMTLFIWVVADRSVLRSSKQMNVPIEVDSLDQNFRVAVLSPSPAEMTVSFNGPGRGIDGLASRQPRLAFRYSLSAAEAREAAATGKLTLQARQGFAYLLPEKVTLDSTTAAEVVVRIDQVKRVRVPVGLSAEDKKLVAQGWNCEPSEISAIVPAAVLEKMQGRPWFAVPQLNLDSTKNAGQQMTQKVNLRPSIEGAEVTFDPPQATVTCRLLTVLQKKALNNIRIRVEAPQEIYNSYTVVLPDGILNNLRVKGPSSEVDALSNEDVKAVLVLKPDDRPSEGSYWARSLEVRFPEGGSVRLDEEFPHPTVNFNLKDRAAATDKDVKP